MSIMISGSNAGELTLSDSLMFNFTLDCEPKSLFFVFSKPHGTSEVLEICNEMAQSLSTFI